MVVIKIFAGLGNQMFQYALSKAISDKSCFLDFESDNYLNNFNISYSLFNKNSFPKGLYFNFRHKKIIDPIWDKIDITKVGNYTYLNGYWAYPCYFQNVIPKLRLDFEIKNKRDAYKNAVLFIESGNYTAIHIRRGDYLNPENTIIFKNLTFDYYNKAINYIQSQDPSTKFIVFSNDMAWCKENFGLSINVLFCDDLFSLKDFEELHLMAKCRNIILANSTFSWWAAFLNSNPESIIIRPKIWYNLKQAQGAYEKGELLFLDRSIPL